MYEIFKDQHDRFELVQQRRWTVNEARDLVQQRAMDPAWQMRVCAEQTEARVAELEARLAELYDQVAGIKKA